MLSKCAHSALHRKENSFNISYYQMGVRGPIFVSSGVFEKVKKLLLTEKIKMPAVDYIVIIVYLWKKLLCWTQI